MSFDKEMQKALEADGEKLRQMTGEDHGPDFFDDWGDGECWNCGGEGYVFDCLDGCCEDADVGCDICTERCDICNPSKKAGGVMSRKIDAINAKPDDGGLAFPGTRCEQVGMLSDHGFTEDDSPTFGDVHHPGMSLRDWFAGQAIGAVIQQCAIDLRYGDTSESPAQYFARKAYEVSDAMLAARTAGE